MLIGRRYTTLLSAVPDDAPPGGGGAPAAAQPPPGDPAPKTGAQAGPAEPELLKDPRFLAILDARMAEADKRGRAEADRRVQEAEKKVRDELAEQQRMEKLSVEERAKQEAATAKGAATKAANEAAEARAEANFLRALLGAGLQPQDDMCEAMAWQAAKRLAGEGQPVTADTLLKLRTEKGYLFKSATTTTTVPAGSNPAEVAAARTLSTQPASSGAQGSAALVPEDANLMSPEQWAAVKAKAGLR